MGKLKLQEARNFPRVPELMDAKAGLPVLHGVGALLTKPWCLWKETGSSGQPSIAK